MQTIQCFRCGSSRNCIAAVLLCEQEAGIKADLEWVCGGAPRGKFPGHGNDRNGTVKIYC